MLPEIVLFAIVRVLSFNTPLAVFSEMVLLLMVLVAEPCTSTPDVLPEMVLLLIARVPLLSNPKEDPPLRVTFSSVKFPEFLTTAMRLKAGAFPWRTIVAPLPSIVILTCNRGQTDGKITELVVC